MKKIIITAGGTSEKIDNVRKITNSSSGKLGMLIATQFLKEIKDIKIYYICSKTSLKPLNERVEIIEIEGTIDLKNNIEKLLINNNIDYFIHSMAVSDYTVDYVTTAESLANSIANSSSDNVYNLICNHTDKLNDNKISSNEENLIIKLKKTPKIISIIKDISPCTYLVGFKLLDSVSKNVLIEVAKNLRDKNKCDLVVANDLSDIRNGNHTAYIIGKDDSITEVEGKQNIAEKLVRRIKNER